MAGQVIGKAAGEAAKKAAEEAAKKAAKEAAKKKAKKALQEKATKEAAKKEALTSKTKGAKKASQAPNVIREKPAGQRTASDLFDKQPDTTDWPAHKKGSKKEKRDRNKVKTRILDYMKSKSPAYQKMEQFKDIQSMATDRKIRKEARGLAKEEMVDFYTNKLMKDIKKGPKINFVEE